ncbi:dehydrogenase [Sphingopyxis sp. 2PD]|uniref:GHMP family kinase ATP-binding protein n=1 Tax=Sphingopyxis sp. 2PD TaxID=2502196 RepID=UPI002015F117|nr:dehydrogenase [Sphingopyxis sp. 2PD]
MRLGLAGGGTDLSPYCDQYGGATLNVTIDRFAFATLLPTDRPLIRFVADDVGMAEEFDLDGPLDTAKLVLHRGVYERMIRDFGGGIRIPMSIATTVDAPSGSGLGSSSALVVALVEAMRAVLDAPLGPYDVAKLAFEIERIDLGLAGGRQDQYAAAFGGMNFIEYLANDRVIVNPLRLNAGVRNEVETSIVTCYTGQSRESASIITEQVKGMTAADGKTVEALHKLKSDAIDMKAAVLNGNIDEMARILNESWLAKRATAAAVANQRINEMLEFGLQEGALGGKVSGAGGGGFLFFLVHPEWRYRLITSLNAAGAMASPVKIVERGCEVWQI